MTGRSSWRQKSDRNSSRPQERGGGWVTGNLLVSSFYSSRSWKNRKYNFTEDIGDQTERKTTLFLFTHRPNPGSELTLAITYKMKNNLCKWHDTQQCGTQVMQAEIQQKIPEHCFIQICKFWSAQMSSEKVFFKRESDWTALMLRTGLLHRTGARTAKAPPLLKHWLWHLKPLIFRSGSQTVRGFSGC